MASRNCVYSEFNTTQHHCRTGHRHSVILKTLQSPKYKVIETTMIIVAYDVVVVRFFPLSQFLVCASINLMNHIRLFLQSAYHLVSQSNPPYPYLSLSLSVCLSLSRLSFPFPILFHINKKQTLDKIDLGYTHDLLFNTDVIDSLHRLLMICFS
jgi:hypothetical protein